VGSELSAAQQRQLHRLAREAVAKMAKNDKVRPPPLLLLLLLLLVLLPLVMLLLTRLLLLQGVYLPLPRTIQEEDLLLANVRALVLVLLLLVLVLVLVVVLLLLLVLLLVVVLLLLLVLLLALLLLLLLLLTLHLRLQVFEHYCLVDKSRQSHTLLSSRGWKSLLQDSNVTDGRFTAAVHRDPSRCGVNLLSKSLLFILK